MSGVNFVRKHLLDRVSVERKNAVHTENESVQAKIFSDSLKFSITSADQKRGKWQNSVKLEADKIFFSQKKSKWIW